MRIAVDAMGGDHAPRCIVEGAAMAVTEGGLRPAEILLVGRREQIEPQLAQRDLAEIEVLHASEVVEMDESASTALRNKKQSSIAIGLHAVVDGRADAFVSAGNTGAVVAAGSLILGRLAGVARPGIAAPMPTRRGPSVVIDVGANIYCKPEHMLQYAIMATEYARATLGKETPRVGLLNIGAEEGKGNPLILQAHTMIQEAALDYVGFIEGQDVMSGAVDVVVCEGFVGNTILKVAEGLASFVGDELRDQFDHHAPSDEVARAVEQAFAKLDYAEYGGAPLLGVSAPVLIGHGRSSAHAIMNMIRAACAAVAHDVNRHILERIEATSERPLP